MIALVAVASLAWADDPVPAECGDRIRLVWGGEGVGVGSGRTHKSYDS